VFSETDVVFGLFRWILRGGMVGYWWVSGGITMYGRSGAVSPLRGVTRWWGLRDRLPSKRCGRCLTASMTAGSGPDRPAVGWIVGLIGADRPAVTGVIHHQHSRWAGDAAGGPPDGR